MRLEKWVFCIYESLLVVGYLWWKGSNYDGNKCFNGKSKMKFMFKAHVNGN